VWSSDITPEDNPYEAGLGFAVKLAKATPFVGRDALRVVKEQGPQRRLRCLTLDDPLAVTLGSEPVRVSDTHQHASDERAGEDTRITGRVTSGGYGFRVGHSLAFAYLPAATAEIGRRVEVEVFGDWIGATVVSDPVWDPTGERIKA